MAMVLSLCACGGTRSAAPDDGSKAAHKQTAGADGKQEAAEPAEEASQPAEEAAEPAAEAAETTAGTETKKDFTETYKVFGMTVHYPEQFANTTGVFYPRGGNPDPLGISAVTYYYAAMPQADF